MPQTETALDLHFIGKANMAFVKAKKRFNMTTIKIYSKCWAKRLLGAMKNRALNLISQFLRYNNIYPCQYESLRMIYQINNIL